MAYGTADKSKAKTESDEEILEGARRGLKECIDEEETERGKMRDDLRFATLDQWPDDIRKSREDRNQEGGPRPCLTIDKYAQFRTQVVNDSRQGKPGINVRPQDDSADPQTAKILKGLVRNIEDQSNADIAYMGAIGSAVDIGLGYFRVTTEYVSDESFDQEIFIRPIANTFSVYLGKHVMPDGSDAEIGYIVESMPKEKFKETYPKAKCEDKDFEGLDTTIVGFWKTAEAITVVEEYRICRTAQTLYFLADGTTITKEDYDRWPQEAGVPPSIQDDRTTVTKQLKWRKMTAVGVLDKRELPGKYIPIIEVIGRESWVEGRRIVWGLVRPVKDSLRMYNYCASTITEKMALAPKTPFIGAEGQFEGHEEKWKKANQVSYAYLPYKLVDVNGNAVPPPQRVAPAMMETALTQQMQMIEHDVQTSLGMFKAAVGESESQQSGRAILALQRESDTSTFHFGANLGVSIRHAGRIIVDLIPHYYDTKRVVRILGEDGEVKTAQIDPEQDVAHRQIQTSDGLRSIYNPGVGKYDVSITVGPSYNTKRMEAAATFVEMAKGAADPASAAVMRYLVMRNSDTAGSDEAAKLLKALLPPQALQAMDSNEPIPPAAQMKIMQLTQAVQGMQQAGAELQQENIQLKSGAQAKDRQTQADHDAEMKKLALEREVEKEKARLARDKAIDEYELEKWVAEKTVEIEQFKANCEKKKSEDKMQLEQSRLAQEQEFKRSEMAKDDEAKVMPDVLNIVQKLIDDQKQFATDLVAAIGKNKTKNVNLTMPDGRQAKVQVVES